MAKSFKYCAECDSSRCECQNGNRQDRLQDHKRRERVRQADLAQFDFTDPMAVDP